MNEDTFAARMRMYSNYITGLRINKEHHAMMGSPDASAIASFRYRLREASRQALELGDKLLQLSQDAPEPNVSQLKEMREMESSLDVCLRFYLRDLANPAIRS